MRLDAPSRRSVAVGLAAMPGLLAAGCTLTEPTRRREPVAAADPDPLPPAVQTPVDPATIGTGPVKVALILPLTGSPQGVAAAASLRNAAALAIAEFATPEITILVRDDRGTAEGAREAATAALDQGAELILGPLFAPAVAAAASVARTRSRPVMAFSTDAGIAQKGVYLLSFLPQNEVERVVEYAAAQGRRSIAALVPETPYGSVVEAILQETASRRGMRVAAVERYPTGRPADAAARLAAIVAGANPAADALFLPIGGDDLAAAGAALASAGFRAARVKPLGTGLWSDPRAQRVAAIAGGWYAAPDGAGFAGFATRYRERYGEDPARIATLAYDAASLAAALARMAPPARFAEATLGARTGFAGADGLFRFRADGTGERALAVNEIRPEGAVVVSPAAKAFPAGA